MGPTTFPLFSPPAAWHVETTGPQQLQPARDYFLSFYGVGQSWTAYYGRLNFTADDIASLRPGQVWADDRAMSRHDFEDLVADKC